MAKKVTAPQLLEMKRAGQRIVCLTAYDFPSAQMADAAGVDVVLVGDSLGNVVMGDRTTLGVSLEMIAHHLRAVRNGLETALLVADMPFGSYGASVAQAVESAAFLMKNGAEAVKLEGDYPEVIVELSRAGIPCMGHVGFTPQSVNKFGGFKVQGRGESGQEVIDTALRLDTAGAIGIVLELMPAELAGQVTKACQCPTIGIGAGIDCDGEIQVWHDVLGLGSFQPKHSHRFVDGRTAIVDALKQYSSDVRTKNFPLQDNSF